MGQSHHCAIGVGHIADQIHKVGQILNLDFEQVCC